MVAAVALAAEAVLSGDGTGGPLSGEAGGVAGAGAGAEAGATDVSGNSVLGFILGFAALVSPSCTGVWRVTGTGVNLSEATGVTATAAPAGFALPFDASRSRSWALRLW